MSENLASQLHLLPDYLGGHLQVALLALLLGVAISLPLGVLLHRRRALQGPVLGIVSVIQTIPGLALLALMVPLLGQIGFVPALIALTLYSMLPVVQNTVAGLAGVDPDAVEAGRGIGMTPGQLLRDVELPLAAPVILAGVRTAAVWTVGMATLATPVGWTSLGNYIFAGLQTQNMTAVLVGCIAAALLALALDGLIRLLEYASRKRSPSIVLTAGVGLALIAGMAVMPLVQAQAPIRTSLPRVTTQTKPGASASKEQLLQKIYPRGKVVIGAKTFTEQYILAAFLSNYLAERSYQPKVLSDLGSTVVFDALKAGKVDCYVDYSGTIWANYLKRTDMLPGDKMLAEITKKLGDQGISVIPLGFENAYCLAMRGQQARELGIGSIADLAVHASQLKMGSDYEFFQRPEWAAVRDAYGLKFKKQITLDPSLMYSAVKESQVDVISAYSTDGRIAAFDLAVLDDPKQALPPYDAVILVGSHAPIGLAKELEPLSNTINNETMRQANEGVDVNGNAPGHTAEWLIRQLVTEDGG